VKLTDIFIAFPFIRGFKVWFGCEINEVSFSDWFIAASLPEVIKLLSERVAEHIEIQLEILCFKQWLQLLWETQAYFLKWSILGDNIYKFNIFVKEILIQNIFEPSVVIFSAVTVLFVVRRNNLIPNFVQLIDVFSFYVPANISQYLFRGFLLRHTLNFSKKRVILIADILSFIDASFE